MSAGFSPVLAGAASTDSLAPTTLTERDTETQTTVMRYSTNIHKVCGTHSIAHDNKCLKIGHTLIMYRENSYNLNPEQTYEFKGHPLRLQRRRLYALCHRS